MSRTPFSKISQRAHWSKRKYLRYGEVQGNVLPPPHGTEASAKETHKFDYNSNSQAPIFWYRLMMEPSYKFQTTFVVCFSFKQTIFLKRSLYVKLKDCKSNSVDPDYEPSHLDLCCLQKPIIIACGSERVNCAKNHVCSLNHSIHVVTTDLVFELIRKIQFWQQSFNFQQNKPTWKK